MTRSSPELRNIQAILGLERETRERRSVLDRLTDVVSSVARINLLTLAVSLEAIVLTGFVLIAQHRMTQEADKRANLDLQINLLAKQELTAILKLQCLLADRAGIDVASVDPRLDQLRSQIDVQRLAATIETEMAAAPTLTLRSSGEKSAVQEVSRAV